MSQSELPLYPKISSIYNKIMQLAIAIVLLIVVLNLWSDNGIKFEQTVEQQFRFTIKQYADQTALTLGVLNIDANSAALHHFFEQLSQQQLVKDAHLYDQSGQEIMASADALSINDLYGISAHKLNRAELYTPVVVDINTESFKGYLRLTFVKKILVEGMLKQNYDQQQLERVMLLFAGLIGFFLTRGLNRFSRQGYRIAKR
jgi:membrane protein